MDDLLPFIKVIIVVASILMFLVRGISKKAKEFEEKEGSAQAKPRNLNAPLPDYESSRKEPGDFQEAALREILNTSQSVKSFEAENSELELPDQIDKARQEKQRSKRLVETPHRTVIDSPNLEMSSNQSSHDRGGQNLTDIMQNYDAEELAVILPAIMQRYDDQADILDSNL